MSDDAISADAVATAIATVEDSRRTHVEWREYLEAEKPTCDHEHCLAAWAERIRVAGDYDHHQRAIEGYDQVLGVLRAVVATGDEGGQ